MIRWKNKNPYLNLYREACKIVLSTDAVDKQLKNLNMILNEKDYSGKWLFKHPSEKYAELVVAYEGEECVTKSVDYCNPYQLFLQFARTTLKLEIPAKDKISMIKQELGWMNSNPRLQDWAMTNE